MIFSRSSGLTTVRDAAPATPPAMKYEVIWGLRFRDARIPPFFSSGAITSRGDCEEVEEANVMSQQQSGRPGACNRCKERLAQNVKQKVARIRSSCVGGVRTGECEVRYVGSETEGDGRELQNGTSLRQIWPQLRERHLPTRSEAAWR